MQNFLLRLLLQLLPATQQFKLLKFLVGRPQRKPAKANGFMADAQQLHYGRLGDHTAWAKGEGPLVICVHGWGGAGGADMGALGEHLVAAGFRVIAIDMTGHGASPGKHIGLHEFIDDVSQFAASLTEPVYCWLGYSAGGLSVMAARAQGKIRAPKFICLATPSQPFPPLMVIRKKLKVRGALYQRFQDYVVEPFHCTWEEIPATLFQPLPGEELMVIHSRDDTFISHENGPLIAQHWPGAKVATVTGPKHAEVPSNSAVLDLVVDFVRTPAPARSTTSAKTPESNH
ncbi:alpha/beta fold hydrolase [Halioxenophilus sp. WMMB6]|uniref:alpha/beta fold hydrolase n=1 Tax=Halioxenophilus sp. WMMB6 TaxID=3073815 RepID=UPI00295E3B2D|nr:alpha/beta fold hydrolase [Halioxenophilus sp. WMMB6]